MTSFESLVAAASRRAVATGSLVSIGTDLTIVEDHGVPFLVHVTSLQDSKARFKRAQQTVSANPFQPPDPDLFVAEVPPRHAAVLNKFNVLHRHLLIVTRQYEPQEDLLDAGDFEALATCMAGLDGLGFYNAGTTAGASQPHKHLQLVPTPLGSGPLPTPIDTVIDDSAPVGAPVAVSAFPFRHLLIPLGDRPFTTERGHELWTAYDLARRRAGIGDGEPYNLLVTRRWMLVVPRCREHWHGVSVNALGFAGSLLVRSRSELDDLERVGPIEVLRSVVEPTS